MNLPWQALNMGRSVIGVFLAVAAMTFAAGFSAVAAQEQAASEMTASAPGWMDRDTLGGDWGGVRPWLKEHGITLQPRLTQFYQGMPTGDGAHGFEYGGKADLLSTRRCSFQGSKVATPTICRPSISGRNSVTPFP